jgi:general stress protein 26
VDRAELVAFVRRHALAVVATRGPNGTPQTAEYSVAITDDAEFIFEISIHSQKYANILQFPQVALVVGAGEPVVVQSEGVADVLTDATRDRCLRVYFQQFPAGRERALEPDIAHIRVRPQWVRLSDKRPESYGVQEIQLEL